MTDELAVLLEGRVVGRAWQGPGGELGFAYEPAWREGDSSYPLSLSIPLARREHRGPQVRAYLEGLLPDNERILQRWGALFGVSPRNPLALLAHVGEDCAGAVQLVRPERVEPLLRAEAPPVEWLTEADVAERLRSLRHDGAAWREPQDVGRFSLAGAQPKTALLNDGGRWGVPAGRVPTTHILKPPLVDLEGVAVNEHVCLRLASALGIPAARSRVAWFEDQAAIVVERYDRLRVGGGLVRIHQEDFCQALGVPPRSKYENEGGPGAARMLGVVQEHSSDAARDVAALCDALALNWAIAGTDGHAKNYSLLVARGQVRLAPLYDVVSALPYPKSLPPRRLGLAMRIGGEYLVWKIGRRHWEQLAAEAGLDGDAVLQRVRELVEEVPDRLYDVCGAAREDGLGTPVLDALENAGTENARRCLAALDRRDPVR